MLQDHRALALGFVGIVLVVVGQVGETIIGGLGFSVHRFTPNALAWSAVSAVGGGMLGIAWLLEASKAKRPRLVRSIGVVLLLVSGGGLALIPFVYQHAR